MWRAMIHVLVVVFLNMVTAILNLEFLSERMISTPLHSKLKEAKNSGMTVLISKFTARMSLAKHCARLRLAAGIPCGIGARHSSKW